MTVSTEVDHNDYTGNGVTTVFPYQFRIFKKSDLTVTVIDLDENMTTLVLDTDYTVSGAGGYVGGNVTLSQPLTSGYQISIARDLPVTQETDLRNQGSFFAEVHEDAFDKLTMLIQQVGSMFSLALRKPSSIANWYDALNNYIRNLRDPRDPQDAATKNYVDSLAGSNFSRTLRVPEPINQFPDAAGRANKMPAFDNSGNAILVVPQSGSASDVMIEFAKPTGAGLSGYNGALTYLAGTVGSELKNINSEINYLESMRASAVKNLATVFQKINAGTSISIACYGDSLTYSVDTTATGTNPPINGATDNRSAKPYPDAIQTALGSSGITASVSNRGYPGDTSVMGYTRWASAGATDVSIIMFGTNDALRTSVLVAIDAFRVQMCQWVEREILKGAAVILMAPPKVLSVSDNKKVSPYRAQMKSIAQAYNLPFVDSVEQLSALTNLYTDGVHLSTFAYFELGWHLAAFFASKEDKARTISGGAFFLPQDNIIQTTNVALRTESLAVGGYLYQLDANVTQDISLGAYFEEDVIPVIHSYNSSPNNTVIRANYGGAPDSSNLAGVPLLELVHTPGYGVRQRLFLPRLNKGYRLFSIWNASPTQGGFIEAIEFIPVKDCLATNNGLLMKLNNLSGTHKPTRYYGSFNYWWAVDQSVKLVKTNSYVARLTLSANDHCGMAIINGMQNDQMTFNGNSVCAFRNAAALVIREYVNGTPTDTSAASVFASSGDWTGEMEMSISGTTLNVYIDGALKATKSGITNVQGYPALMAKPTTTLVCYSAWLTGYSKPYFN